jgi:hypothetical protein
MRIERLACVSINRKRVPSASPVQHRSVPLADDLGFSTGGSLSGGAWDCSLRRQVLKEAPAKLSAVQGLEGVVCKVDAVRYVVGEMGLSAFCARRHRVFGRPRHPVHSDPRRFRTYAPRASGSGERLRRLILRILAESPLGRPSPCPQHLVSSMDASKRANRRLSCRRRHQQRDRRSAQY